MVIGLKLMEIANKPKHTLTNLDLSIQISLNGLSFCVLHKPTNTITFLKHIDTDKKVTPFKILDLLKHAFVSETMLQNTFNNVTVVHVNELSTFVPKELFNEELLADYLKFNAKILKSDYITFDTLSNNNSVNVYVPFVNINNYLYERFGEFSYKHVSTVLVEKLLEAPTEKQPKLYIHVSKFHYEIVIIENGQLILYNTFEYNTQEDFIYYILFIIEQLNLNPESVETILLGNIVKDDNYYNILYKYIRHVSFGSKQHLYSFKTQPDLDYSDFTLIHSL
ncbi:DUF3822 family protein [Corallibacter vietnamensis]|uniref:DUF3822 family protein n=2 Tax=Corallibacter vietnamensis TaxID=904130 RepID=A0ABP7HCT0_9FLAO